MAAPQSPADMQSFILEQLTKNALPETGANRAHDKFATELSELIDTRLKDRIYHLVDARALQTTTTETLEFLHNTDAQVPVSILTDELGAIVAIVRYDLRFPEILARLYFGGETESPVVARETPLTAGELGLLQLFANSISRTIEGRTSITENVVTSVRKDLDLEEISNGEVVLCQFEIEMEAGKFPIEIAIPEAYVGDEDGQAENQGTSGDSGSNQEVKQVRVPAVVKLKAPPSTLQVIRTLKVGDCLSLSENGKLNGQILVKGHELFEGEIGRSGDTYSIKISDPVAAKGKLDALSNNPFGAPQPPQF